jgi:SAM-dependent methyltransferase
MDLDWPMSETAGDGDEYVKYADVYDVLFGDLSDDAEFYIRCAGTRIREGGAILEVGTGTGRVAEHLLKAGYRVTGIDASAEMLAHAARKLTGYEGRFDWAQADVRRMSLGRTFPVAIAPYGMMAHILTDEDRRASFRRVYEHLEPGGIFVFDDMPGWLAGHADGKGLDVRRTGFDAAAGMPVRMMSNCIEVAGKPLSVRYDFVDWLDGDKVAKRLVIRVVFRDISLADELALLKEVGFHEVDLFGDFDGRPFDRQNLAANTRLILRCRRSA